MGFWDVGRPLLVLKDLRIGGHRIDGHNFGSKDPREKTLRPAEAAPWRWRPHLHGPFRTCGQTHVWVLGASGRRRERTIRINARMNEWIPVHQVPTTPAATILDTPAPHFGGPWTHETGSPAPARAKTKGRDKGGAWPQSPSGLRKDGPQRLQLCMEPVFVSRRLVPPLALSPGACWATRIRSRAGSRRQMWSQAEVVECI